MKPSLILFLSVALQFTPLSATTLFLSLDVFSLEGPPGSSVTFSGQILNETGGDVYLNGATADLEYAELTFDPTPFFTLAPLVLSDGQSYTGDLFSVSISDVALAGDYFGTLIIQGGADSSTLDIVGTTAFQVSVADIPEPSAESFCAAGITLLLFLKAVRRRCG
jgi:hypothetical protein